ncbi:MAG: nucleotidyl transferase AbiEii/AbiGii toxin family protein [Propionibacteriaceae bacterium]|nr:nucleotidyl transferase AbiEii/AbiGii toxin family protein [Propionibacteriaceae bacterium]
MAHELDFTGFRADATEKVIRLLTILNSVSADPWLRMRVCLHGGTAINLFALDAPRLSVDIDLNYIGHADRDAMMAERDDLEQAIIDTGNQASFTVVPGKSEHSGRKFLLHYQGSHGPDHVKIDLDYLNRSPLLPSEPKTVHLSSGGDVTFPVNSDIELFAGKTKALVERVAVRDLYDIAQISQRLPALYAQGDEVLLSRIMLYYLSMSAPFPRALHVADRFAGREHEITATLHPMLLAGDEPTLADLIDTAETYLVDVSQPHDDQEAEYLYRAGRADFAPECLFSDYPDTLAAAHADPQAAWKMRNLANVL